MAFRKQASLAAALAITILCIGCADQINNPITTDEQPVLPPTNVSAFALTDGHVRVKWDPSSEPTINGYNLYRREVGHGKPNRINHARILATEYMDGGTTAPKNYEYRLTAVNSKGKESHFVSVVIGTKEIVNSGGDKLPALGTE